MSLAKLGIIILIAFAGFLGGHYVASNKAIASEALAVKGVEDQKKVVEETLATERRTWDKERADLNALAAKNLQIAHDEAAAKELAVRKAVRMTEAKYQSKLKELENERNQALNVATDNSPTGGLWIDVTSESCVASGSSSGAKADGVSKAGGPASGSSTYLRCRIAPEPAQALVKIADTSDHRTELLNKCINTLSDQQTILNPLEGPPNELAR